MSTTVIHGFARVAGQRPHLFQVNPGVPAGEALGQASLMLAAAQDMAEGYIELDLSNDAWGLAYLIQMAKAVVDSVAVGATAITD
jgi:hypothetical protein